MKPPLTLVLLPGMDGTGRLFAPFVQKLPDWITPLVVAYPADPLLGWSALLDVVLAALPDDRPFVLLGESFSGPLAVMAAAYKPKGLLGVILCASFVKFPLRLPLILRRLISHPILGIFKGSVLVTGQLLGSNPPVELRALVSQTLAEVHPRILSARARMLIELDCSNQLRACAAPMLAIYATHDRIVPFRNIAMITAIRPDSAVAEIAGPHLILQCQPDEAIGIVANFVLSLPR